MAAASIERGLYLVTAMACNDCHTPLVMTEAGPVPDIVMPAPPKLPEGPRVWVGSGSNTAFAGPWGVNLGFNRSIPPIRNNVPDAIAPEDMAGEPAGDGQG